MEHAASTKASQTQKFEEPAVKRTDWRKLHFICTNSCRVRFATADCPETWPAADRDACGDPPVITGGNADLLQHHSPIKMISLTLQLFLHFLCYAQIQKKENKSKQKMIQACESDTADAPLCRSASVQQHQDGVQNQHICVLCTLSVMLLKYCILRFNITKH